MKCCDLGRLAGIVPLVKNVFGLIYQLFTKQGEQLEQQQILTGIVAIFFATAEVC